MISCHHFSTIGDEGGRYTAGAEVYRGVMILNGTDAGADAWVQMGGSGLSHGVCICIYVCIYMIYIGMYIYIYIYIHIYI